MTLGDWYVCDACRPLVKVADWDNLTARVGLPVPVPTTILSTWQTFAAQRAEAEPIATY